MEGFKMSKFKPEQFISGTIICDNCHREIKWRYNIPLKEYGIYTGSYHTDTIFASKLDKHDDSNNTFYVRCRNCDKKNYFEYKVD